MRSMGIMTNSKRKEGWSDDDINRGPNDMT
jgi:hypothetical protein